MRLFAAIVVVTLLAASARAAHVSVEALADRTAVEPGGKATVALVFTIEPNWHLYWTNPGDTGSPPKVKWTLPSGVTAGPLQFPTPHRIDAGGVTAFGYVDQLVLLVDVAVPSSAAGSLDLKADLRWVVCADACVLESKSLVMTLPVGPGEASPAAAKIAGWRMLQPNRSAEKTTVAATIAADGKTGTIDLPITPGVVPVDFFPPKSDFAVYGTPAVVGGVFRVPFRVLPEAPAEYSGVGVVTRRDEKSTMTSSAEMTVTYKFSAP